MAWKEKNLDWKQKGCNSINMANFAIVFLKHGHTRQAASEGLVL